MAHFFLRYPAVVPRKPKKPPWNAGINLFPELTGKPVPAPAPMPPPSGPAATLTTGMMVPGETEPQWECLRCERLKIGKDVEGLDHIRQCPWRGKGDPAVG